MAQPLSPLPNVTPATGDQANAVISGTFTAAGTSLWIPLYGTFNVVVWGSTVTTLTTTAGSAAATVASATGLAVGQTIVGANVPKGTTIGALSGTNVTLAIPPTSSVAAVAAGADAAATFIGTATTSSIQIERSFDGGSTWIVCGVGGGGSQAVYTNVAALSLIAGEPERQVGYRLNCTAISAGTLNYRISATGQMAISAGALTT